MSDPRAPHEREAEAFVEAAAFLTDLPKPLGDATNKPRAELPKGRGSAVSAVRERRKQQHREAEERTLEKVAQRRRKRENALRARKLLSAVEATCTRLATFPVPPSYHRHSSRAIIMWLSSLPFVLEGLGGRRFQEVQRGSFHSFPAVCRGPHHATLGAVVGSPFLRRSLVVVARLCSCGRVFVAAATATARASIATTARPIEWTTTALLIRLRLRTVAATTMTAPSPRTRPHSRSGMLRRRHASRLRRLVSIVWPTRRLPCTGCTTWSTARFSKRLIDHERAAIARARPASAAKTSSVPLITTPLAGGSSVQHHASTEGQQHARAISRDTQDLFTWRTWRISKSVLA